MPLTLLLLCNDLAQTRAFYEGLLGFTASDTAERTLTVEQQGGKLIFTQQNLWQRSVGCSGTLYFAVADVDGYFDAVKNKAPIAWPLQTMSYGSKEFGVTDCNGYTLAFRQRE